MKVSVAPFVHSWPAPATLIGCGDSETKNLITISWFGTVNSEPPMVSISVRPSRHSFGLIQKSGEFTVNIPRASDLEAVIYCGEHSGRNVDKFKHLGLTAIPCPPLQYAPMMAESLSSFGCQVRKELSLGTHSIFIAEIVSAYYEENLLRPEGRPLSAPESQIVWLDRRYWGLKSISG